jgi:non-ribosomal peptide synthase protein (TIGR01720 family)
MIPSYFIQLDKLPLTPNGKVDRRMLPESDENIETGVEYEAPRDDKEEKLALIWQEVLKVERVGIKDSFFALGGDSIKAIQISARVQKYGYKLQVRDLLKYPSIGELSKYVEAGGRTAEQGVITGEAELTPIQSWFFKQQFNEKHHWNQAVMLYSREGFEEDIIKKVFTKIAEHHDILRSVYIEEEGRVTQRIREAEGELFAFKVYAYGEEKDYKGKITEEAGKLQGSINLSEGPLVKVGLFKTAEGDYLLIAIHHLVVDGVSWRILFEDLAAGYKQAKEGKEIELPHKTASYKQWGDMLKGYSNSEVLLKEIKYWEALEKESEANHLEKDKEIQCRKVKDSRTITITLPEEETEKLLKQVNKAYNTEVNDILLAALGMAVKEWTGKEKVVIDLEGHGRERIGEIDITRTIGWFTTTYPVILNISHSDNIGCQIKAVKEALRQIPNKGIGYGVLKYLTVPENRKELKFNTRPEMGFNYLGQFDSDINTEVFGISQLSGGSSISLESEMIHAIDINGMVAGGKLSVNISCNKLEYDAGTVEKLAERYETILIRLIEHCISKEDIEITPSDISASTLDLEELEEALDVFEHIGK